VSGLACKMVCFPERRVDIDSRLPRKGLPCTDKATRDMGIDANSPF